MDDDTRKYLDAVQAATLAAINGERLLGLLRADFNNAKGFLLTDAIVQGQRIAAIETRVAELEKKG